MRVTIKYSMAVEEGMRRFFFLSSLVSASGNRHVIRSRADSLPGGRSGGGAGRGPSADQPAPSRRSRPAPAAAALRSAPAPRRPPALGRCRSPPRAHTHTHARRGAGTQPAARARCGGGLVLRGSATCSPALREVASRRRPLACCPPAVAMSPPSAPPEPRRCHAGAEPSRAEVCPGGGRRAPAAAQVQRRAPRCVRSGYRSCRSGGRGRCAWGYRACEHTRG